jgi:lactate dehydrogenase-like 2-hydroxyacid dehydrogenase
MQPVLSFPALAGMAYPRLAKRGLIRFVAEPEDAANLAAVERDVVRVLMTSASRGLPAQVAAALPNLGLVISQGAGQDKFDLAVLGARGIRLRSVGEAVVDDVADLALALTHVLVRDLIRADAFARSGTWRTSRFEVGDSVVGMTMGIAGLSGRIGQAIASRAKASRMSIAGLDRPSNQGLGARLCAGWRELAEASDVLVLAVPANPSLKHVVNAEVLAALGTKGRLINVGRGSLVDTSALIEALERKTIAGAGLDVLETEPEVPPRLAALPNVVLTPHIGAQTWGQRSRAARIAEDEVLAYLAS